MIFLLTALMLLLCLGLINRMYYRGHVLDFHFGITGVFAIGYFVVPILFLSGSPLANYPDEVITQALGIHLMFFAVVVAGGAMGAYLFRSTRPLEIQIGDKYIDWHHRALFLGCYISYVFYLLYGASTSYSSSSFDAVQYLATRNPFFVALYDLSSFALGIMALTFAIELKRPGRRITNIPISWLMGAGILSIVAASINFAQRLTIITPLLCVFAALAVTRQLALAVRATFAVVVILALVSPLAVYMRQTQTGLHGADALEAARSFSYEDSILTTSIRSIADRSDLLLNTIPLKEFIDQRGYAGWPYYYSVIVAPIPKFIFGPKPVPLSTDGSLHGELSVIAWDITGNRGVGSLTAFGGIVAYGEGGWIGVIVDGLATGLFFAFLARWLGQGGLVAKASYVTLFTGIAVKSVPPSFLQALMEFFPVLIAIAFLLLINIFNRSTRGHQVHPARTYAVAKDRK